MKSTIPTKALYLLSIILLFSTCIQKVSDGAIYFTEKDLPKAIDLKGVKYSFPQIINPIGVFLKDGKAIVFERKSLTNDKFHIIDLKTEMYIQSKGVDGLGPGEITVISKIENSGDGDKIWTYDPEQRVFSKFNLGDTSKLAEEQFRAPETASYITEVVWTSDTTLLGNAVDGWTKYLHLSNSGDTLALFSDWKDMTKGKEFPRGLKANDMDANLVSNVFQGPLRASLDKRHFVKIGKSVDYLDVIDIQNQQVKTIYGPTQEIQDFKISLWDGYQMPVFSNERTTRYSDAFAEKNSFYALFRGKPYRELSDPDNLNRIFEFDYDGNILNQYQLDYPIFGFAVDEENKAIYGLTVDREPNLVRFDY